MSTRKVAPVKNLEAWITAVATLAGVPADVAVLMPYRELAAIIRRRIVH